MTNPATVLRELANQLFCCTHRTVIRPQVNAFFQTFCLLYQTEVEFGWKKGPTARISEEVRRTHREVYNNSRKLWSSRARATMNSLKQTAEMCSWRWTERSTGQP